MNQHGQCEIKVSQQMPRVGDRVDMFYEPLPKVTSVVNWPSEQRLAALSPSLAERQIDAIITVE